MPSAASVNEEPAAAIADPREPVMNLIYNSGNPYQNLMYSAADSPVRLEPAPKSRVGRVMETPEAGRARVLHIHWDDRFFGREAEEDSNREEAARILDDLARYKDWGGRIVWTVHNRIAHARTDGETFSAARLKLANMADLVHVHTPHAASHVMEALNVAPERMAIVRHPSYLGAYEPAETTLARPLPEGPTTFLHFGYIRSNKGADMVSWAAKTLSRRQVGGWRLHVVGRAFRPGLRIFRPIEDQPHITIRLEGAPDEEVAGIFGGAHFYLAPFRDLFTSGSVMLAQTFGLPVIAPDMEAVRQMTAPANRDLLYPNDGSPRRLLQRMSLALTMSAEEIAMRRAACFDYGRETAPERMSLALGRAIGALL